MSKDHKLFKVNFFFICKITLQLGWNSFLPKLSHCLAFFLFCLKEVNINSVGFHFKSDLLCFINGLQYNKLPNGGSWEVTLFYYSGNKWSPSVLNCFGVVDKDMEQYNNP